MTILYLGNGTDLSFKPSFMIKEISEVDKVILSTKYNILLVENKKLYKQIKKKFPEVISNSSIIAFIK